MYEEQFEGTRVIPEGWCEELFVRAEDMSETGEVTCDLFVSVVQGMCLQPCSWRLVASARCICVAIACRLHLQTSCCPRFSE